MNDNQRTPWDRNALLDNLAAELTRAAYSVALRHGLRCSWIEMELALWRALAETVNKWTWERPLAGPSDELEPWRQGLLLELTAKAYHVALKHGVKGSPFEMEWDLYRALGSVIEGTAGRAPAPRSAPAGRRSAPATSACR
jgi:hypothetical protein